MFLVKHDGNLSFDEIIEIAKVMRERSMAREFVGTVKEILGTCVSVGCTVDGQSPKEIQQKIADGELEVPDFK
jgi:large subunit ribosomal protein L12e